MIVFFAIKGRLNLDAFSFWYGEIIALLAIDAWILYILYTANIALVDIIVYFIPALGMSVIALLYFGRRQRQIQI